MKNPKTTQLRESLVVLSWTDRQTHTHTHKRKLTQHHQHSKQNDEGFLSSTYTHTHTHKDCNTAPPTQSQNDKSRNTSQHSEKRPLSIKPSLERKSVRGQHVPTHRFLQALSFIGQRVQGHRESTYVMENLKGQAQSETARTQVQQVLPSTFYVLWQSSLTGDFQQ